MAAETFEQRWRRKERELGRRAPVGMIDYGDATLPAEGGPCLSFEDAERAPLLWELYGPADQWTAEQRSRLGGYRVIGSDGAGNPICVEESSGTLWLLDHEDEFQTRQFVNTSVGQLAECLLARMGEKDATRFRKAVTSVDPTALFAQSFWWHEANLMGPNG